MVSATVSPGAPSASRRRAASSISGSQLDSTRSMRRPRSSATTSRTAACSSNSERTWTYAAIARRAASGIAPAGWSPTPMTVAPTSARPRVNSGISAG